MWSADEARRPAATLWQTVPASYRQGTVYTDFWWACQNVIPDEPHQTVGKDTVLTNHALRFNNTLRQRLARFVCKTLSFSKSDAMHLICLHAFWSAITSNGRPSVGDEPLPKIA